MSERKLASIRRISKLEPIEGADKILKATIDGWQVVTAIENGFKVGDLVIYCEIDSWIPTEIAPFLSKGQQPREYNGVKGERLRTVKLRGQISQGLILPLSMYDYKMYSARCTPFEDGENVTEHLGIQKWEAPIPTQLHGQIIGTFPSFGRKTDQERIQNLKKEFEEWKNSGLTFEVTEKCEGSSMTVYLHNGEFGVCSRNMNLKETEGNTFWMVARELVLEEKLRALGCNIMLQGELIGPKIQKGYYEICDFNFLIFDIFNIDSQNYMKSIERYDMVEGFKINHVPIIHNEIKLFDDMNGIILSSNGPSKINPNKKREGLVYKCTTNPSISFKVISNEYLLSAE